MATLRQYFDTDFRNYMAAAQTWPAKSQSGTIEIVARLHQDFTGGSKFASFYVPAIQDAFAVCRELLATVPTLINNVESSIRVAMGYPGAQKDSQTLVYTGHVYIYSEKDFTPQQITALGVLASRLSQVVEVRGSSMVTLRSASERPLAFISHDFRDKELVARPLAVALSWLNCPLWYDEFSLHVGDSLRDSFERGLKECGKCIVVLSPNYLSNEGWTKAESNSIFTRELVETRRLILPVWYQVTKREIYEYSPSLADRFAVIWEGNADGVAHKLYKPLTDQPHTKGFIITDRPVSREDREH
jgi:hypothetical protein